MMLMKTPTSGTSTGTSGRDVIFRLSVEPAADSASKMRTFGDGMQRVQTEVAQASGRRAKDIQNFYRQAFDEVLKHGEGVFERLAERSRMMAGRIAADWNGAMRGLGGPGGPMSGGAAGGSSGFQMNMTALSSVRAAPWSNNPFYVAPAPWAPPKGMGGIGFGAPAWMTQHSFPSMAGSGSSGAPAGGGSAIPGIAGGGGRFNFGAINSILSGGANLARGVAYSGMAGEQDSQKILDTLLRMEGLLALIHGGVSLGKGLGGLGVFSGGAGIGAISAPIAAAIAAALATIAAGKVVSEQVTGAANDDNSWSMGIAKGWVHAGSWIERGSMGLMGAMGLPVDSGSVWGYTQSVLDRNKQAAAAEKMRAGWRDDTPVGQEAARRMGTLVEDREVRRRGIRGNDAEYGALKDDRARMEAEVLNLITEENEVRHQGETASQHAVERRKSAQAQLAQMAKQMAEHELNAAQQLNGLSLQRAQTVQGIARQRMDAQYGLAQSAADRLRSDEEKFGSLSPLEKMRTESAFSAVRDGRATKEQEDIAGGYNAFADKVGASRAGRGKSSWFSNLARDAETSRAEAMNMAKEVFGKGGVNDKLILETKNKIEIELKQAGGDKAVKEAGDQMIQILEDAIAREQQENIRRTDEINRRLNAMERIRQNVVGR